LGPITLRNRVVKCGTNEGMSEGVLVTGRLIGMQVLGRAPIICRAG
jgi:hypothetical protein